MTRVIRVLSPREDDRDLAQAFFACMAVGLVTWFGGRIRDVVRPRRPDVFAFGD